MVASTATLTWNWESCRWTLQSQMLRKSCSAAVLFHRLDGGIVRYRALPRLFVKERSDVAATERKKKWWRSVNWSRMQRKAVRLRFKCGGMSLVEIDPCSKIKRKSASSTFTVPYIWRYFLNIIFITFYITQLKMFLFIQWKLLLSAATQTATNERKGR